MNKVFTKNGWDDYIYWQTEDKNTWKKINKLIEDLCRNGNSGLGKPEPLLGDLSGFWSRRINEKIDWFIRLTNRMYISFHVDIITQITKIYLILNFLFRTKKHR